MIDRLGPGTVLGYCTNVHAGLTPAQVRANLLAHAVPLRRQVSPDQPMGVGLWLAATTARQMLATQEEVAELAAWLEEQGLLAFTFNGFPYGDFHQPVVKHRVYEPDWSDPARTNYTLDLAEILARLLPAGAQGSISTLPVGWKDASIDLAQAGAALIRVADKLAELEDRTGHCIHLDLEPEPGCVLETSASTLAFFRDHLWGNGPQAILRRYLRVCHDVCHASVMFEDQATVLSAYRRAGLRVGKVQISSAITADLDDLAAPQRQEAIGQLASFCEDRYLHQTCVRSASGTPQFHEDLPQALAAHGATPQGTWRVHFHVPLHLARFGHLATTHDDVVTCLKAIEPGDGIAHFEAETYAWHVLPAQLQHGPLHERLAEELRWILEQTPQRKSP